MGFSGYREFQIALAARLSKRDDSGKRTSGYDFTLRATDAEAVTEMFSKTMAKAVDCCLKRVSPESFLRASVWMSQARRLYVYGSDSFYALAFCHTMSKFGIASTVPSLSHEKPYRDKKSLEGDVALFIAYPDCGLREEMSLLRKRGCRVISVSVDNTSPDADISICFPECETGYPCAEVAYVKTAFLYATICLNYMTEVIKRAES